MCDVYKGSRNDVSVLPLCAFLKQKESKTTKTTKKQQEQKRGATFA
jgi:hypothetical protein